MSVGSEVTPDSFHYTGIEKNYQTDVSLFIMGHSEDGLVRLTFYNLYLDDFGFLCADNLRQGQLAVPVVLCGLERVGAVLQEGSEAEVDGKEDVSVVESVFHAFIVSGDESRRQPPSLNPLLMFLSCLRFRVIGGRPSHAFESNINPLGEGLQVALGFSDALLLVVDSVLKVVQEPLQLMGLDCDLNLVVVDAVSHDLSIDVVGHVLIAYDDGDGNFLTSRVKSVYVEVKPSNASVFKFHTHIVARLSRCVVRIR